MLGFTVSLRLLVGRQDSDLLDPALADVASGAAPIERLVSWTGRLGTTDWLDPLEEDGRARCLQGHGYPSLYVVRARDAVESLARSGNATWRGVDRGEYDGWGPVTRRVAALLERCEPADWLSVEVWDES